MTRITRISALAVGIAGVLAMGQAAASGFQLRESSVANVGRAGAGSAVFNGDPSVVSNNPAALAGFETKSIRADVTVIDLTASFNGGGYAAAPLVQANPATAPALALQGGDGGDPGDATAVPNLSFVMPLGGDFEYVTLGASVGAPSGLATDYEQGWVGRYHALESDVKVIDLTLAASVDMGERFSIGAGLIWERAEATLSKAVDFGSALCLQSGNPANCLNPAFPFHPQANDGTFEVQGDDTGMGWLVGFQAKPTDKLSIGYSHRSEIDHELQGTIDFEIPAAVQAGMGPAAVAYADGPGGAKLTLPSVDTLSVRYDFTDNFRLMADYQRTDWSSLREVDVRRSNGAAVGAEAFAWNDSNFYSLGAEFDLSDAFTLRAGIGKDETPTHDETRAPRLPDNDRTNYAIGLTWQATQSLRIDAAYERIEIDNSMIDLMPTATNTASLAGKFSGHADLFGVAAQFNF